MCAEVADIIKLYLLVYELTGAARNNRTMREPEIHSILAANVLELNSRSKRLRGK